MQDEIKLHVRYEDFHAQHDHMSKTLHVTGICHIDGGGFAAHLEPHHEPTANPLKVDLDLVLTPSGDSPSVQPLDWRQAWHDDGHPYAEVDFFVQGITAQAPPVLDIEDVQ
jgi:hypothetical protein